MDEIGDRVRWKEEEGDGLNGCDNRKNGSLKKKIREKKFGFLILH